MNKILSLSLIFILFFMVGCKKYEEGPIISLKSSKSRICKNPWVLKSIKNLATDIKVEYNSKGTLEFNKDGTWTNNAFNFPQSGKGIWSIEGETLTFFFTLYITNEAREDVKILRLTTKDLWFSNSISEYKYEAN